MPKIGTTPKIKILIQGVTATSITKCDFMFRQEADMNCSTKLIKSYPSASVTRDSNGYFNVALTQEETYMFKPNQYFYLDCRPYVVVEGTETIIPTSIVKLYMSNSLFSEDDE